LRIGARRIGSFGPRFAPILPNTMQFLSHLWSSAPAVAFSFSVVAMGIAIYTAFIKRRTLELNSNASLFDLLQEYTSVQYHDDVRSPAWHAIHMARRDETYKNDLLTALLNSTADESHEAYQRRRLGEPTPDQDREFWAFHREYHRLLDVFGFFTIVSLVEPNPQVDCAVAFFYEEWREQLRWVVDELEKKDPQATKVRKYREIIDRLDKICEPVENGHKRAASCAKTKN